MKILMSLVFAFLVGNGGCIPGTEPFAGAQAAHYAAPNPKFTPGVLCTKSNPNFQTLRYAEKIPYCKRKVGEEEKLKVAKAYGIKKADFSKYEFDHLIPLSVGGADDAGNIWPQPILQAKEKDKVEDFVFEQMSKGKMKQAEAIARLRGWFK